MVTKVESAEETRGFTVRLNVCFCFGSRGKIPGEQRKWWQEKWPSPQSSLIETKRQICWKRPASPQPNRSDFLHSPASFPLSLQQVSWCDPSDAALHPLPPPRPPPGCSGPPDPIDLAGVTGQRSKDTEGHQAGLHQGESLGGCWCMNSWRQNGHMYRNDWQIICWIDGHAPNLRDNLKL